MSPKKRRKDAIPKSWRKRTAWPPAVIIGAVIISILAIAVPKGISAALPPVADSKPYVEVSIGSTAKGEWNALITRPDGTPLPCHEVSAGLMNGWDCEGSEVKSHTFATSSDTQGGDPAQPIRRIVRAAYLGEMPHGGAVAVQGSLTVLRLNPDESRRVDADLDENHTITGFMVTNPPGSGDVSYVVVVDGTPNITADVERSLQQSLGLEPVA